MIIIAGYLEVDPPDRDEYVHAFTDFIKTARQATGCLDFSISVDTADPGRMNMFELWNTQEDLDAFRAQAEPPDTDVEFIGGRVQEYLIEYSRDPFTTDNTTPEATP